MPTPVHSQHYSPLDPIRNYLQSCSASLLQSGRIAAQHRSPTSGSHSFSTPWTRPTSAVGAVPHHCGPLQQSWRPVNAAQHCHLWCLHVMQLGYAGMRTFCLLQVPQLDGASRCASHHHLLSLVKGHALHWALVSRQALQQFREFFEQQLRACVCRMALPCAAAGGEGHSHAMQSGAGVQPCICCAACWRAEMP